MLLKHKGRHKVECLFLSLSLTLSLSRSLSFSLSLFIFISLSLSSLSISLPSLFSSLSLLRVFLLARPETNYASSVLSFKGRFPSSVKTGFVWGGVGSMGGSGGPWPYAP